ncbi:hypothetical protein QJS04_geneDACA013574 [Acorus gramineus]|uniref:RBR-type E3 ubiquitin transferase n=1 Tax=Acorus gramineus TaxID=55184 RepID=A0AAV9AI74_ACOGR|nr:hypothetical protein QJS04_geneDACA013574 [Acorus gramineus]
MKQRKDGRKVIHINGDDEDPRFIPISRTGSNKNDPIRVDRYKPIIDVDRCRKRKPSEVVEITIQAFERSSRRRKRPIGPSPSVEPGESSKSSLCGICFEPKSRDEIFLAKTCEHVFCVDCMGSYVASRIQENATDVLCPDPNCDERLEMENCRLILPKEVFDRWGDALCEAVILGSAKFYCPFKDCSALLIDEGVVFEESECPHCHRLFCAKCKVPWHLGITCEEYQKLGVDETGREDIMLKKLAKECRWQRCVKCGFYVEKIQGCTYMKCRCGYGFCYGCGDKLKVHYCVKCKL